MKQPLAACLVAAAAILLFPGALAAEIATPEQKIEALRPLAQQCGGGNDHVKQDLIKNQKRRRVRARRFLPAHDRRRRHGEGAARPAARRPGADDPGPGNAKRRCLCARLPAVPEAPSGMSGAPKIPVVVAKTTAEAAAILDVATVGRVANALAPSLGTCAGNDGGLAKIVLEDAGCLAFLRQMALDEDALGSIPSPASATLSGAVRRAP